MKYLVEFPVDRGGSVFAEVQANEEGIGADGGDSDFQRTASPGDFAMKAAVSFGTALSTVRTCAETILGQLEDLSTSQVHLSQVEVEFGLSLSGRVGAVIASAEAEGNFRIKLSWTPR